MAKFRYSLGLDVIGLGVHRSRRVAEPNDRLVVAQRMSDMQPRDGDAVIPPSSLFVFWPGDQPPMAEEIRLRLLEWGQPAPHGDDDAPEETLWSFWFDLADRPKSYLIWCEPVSEAHLVLLNDVRWRADQQEDEARRCRWVVGIEGPVSLRQPTTDYQLQLKLCDAISRDWAPVIYDANAFLFRTSQDIHHLTGLRTPPRTSSLYTVHKVRSRRAEAEPSYWLHTHGLERAGAPDLELFDVPERLLPAACELLEAVADLWIEFSTPDPEIPFDIGRGIQIAWRPWQAVASELKPADVGGWSYRKEEHGHNGYRAVLVGGRLEGWVRRRWIPPIAVLEQLTKSETTLYKTTSETRRMAQLARERWGSFGLLFAGRHPSDWRFAVKLSYPMPDNPRHGEHLWFEVMAIEPGRIRAKLVSQPTFLQDLSVGQVDWQPLDRLSDWRILTPTRVFDPENADVLLEEEGSVGREAWSVVSGT